MWTRVKEVMESSERVGEAIAKGTLEPRAWTSLSAHLGQMQKAIAKYVGCMKLVESLRESGSTERDMMQKSLSLYKERHGHHFGYMECYDVLAKCPKFQMSVEKVSERKKPARSSKRPGPDNVIVEASLESDANSIISTTVEARPDQGVKGTKRAISEVSMRFRTVVAQETLSKSMISKVDVLKKQLRINQALQRLQVEETLHRMLNKLFSIKPESAEHATYLERRRSGLLRRLSALEDLATPSPPSLEESMGTSGSTAENAMTEANLSDGHSFEQTAASYENGDVLASPAKLSAVCPVVLENVTSLSLSGTQSSFYSSSFPPLTQPSQISSEVDESHV